jgi:cytochrome P450
MQLAQFDFSSPSRTAALGAALCFLLYYIARAIYVVYFHPLARYPGPKSWLFSRLSYSRGLRQGTLLHKLRQLHDIYGPVVRYGVNELSYTDARAWKDVYGFHGGPDKNFDRDPRFYQPAPNGVPSILSAKNEHHASIRRLLAPAFSDTALKKQEYIVRGYVDLLIEKLLNRVNGAPIDISKYFQFTTFDIAGDLMYGESFGCLEREEYHTWLKVMTAFFKRLMIGASLVSLVPAVRPLLPYIIPKKVQEQTRQRFAFTVEKVGQRLAMGEAPNRADFMTYMARTHNKSGFAMARGELDATFDVLVSAGAETTATALTGTVQYLLRNPMKLERLKSEIRQRYATTGDITMASVSTLPYLTAVLNEGMRLCPPAPSMRPRSVPRGGAVVCEQWLPEGVGLT